VLLRPRPSKTTTMVLTCWFLAAPIAMYSRLLPWAQHLFDGYHYAVALLLVRKSVELGLPGWLRRRAFRPSLVAAAAIILSCVTIHAVFRYRAFVDARSAAPQWLPSALAPIEVVDAIRWLRANAQSRHLVLAPDYRGWYATVPMHSFASHAHYSMTFEDQRRSLDRFYKGAFTPEEAQALLDEYGIRFVVVPARSPALKYLESTPLRVSFGKLAIYELPGNEMKPYPGLRKLRAAAGHSRVD
ncbi:MAG: hypothetical protein ACRD44_08195, partial [Bryobacteraceae bacterium]